MKFLKQYEEVFSFMEMEVLKAIGKGASSYKDIANVIYGKHRPAYATTAISAMIDRINRKAQLKKIDLRVEVGGSSGGPVTKTVTLK